MRHRIKKIPTLSKLSHIHNHLLHSDKSTYTYFYKGKGKVKVGNLGKHILYSPSIPLLGGTVLLLVLGLMVSPLSAASDVDKASASSITEDECRRSATVGMQLMGVTGDDVTLTNSTVNDDIEAGRISKVSQDFNVVACNAKSYKIYVQAETSMLKNTSVPDALYGVGENVAESSFPENTWGYNISLKDDTENATSLTYNTVPALSNNIPEAYSANSSTTTAGEDFTITFAANFSKNKPAGHYTSDILLSTVIEPVTAQELWNSITYMQDMTPEACEGGDELGRQLIDKRDNKSYWVARLKDGNCWMTQNLDLDLWQYDNESDAEGHGRILTSADSDVTKNWTSNTGPSTLMGYTTDNNYKAQYYDVGQYVYTRPTTAESCAAINGSLSSEDCVNKGWVEVEGMIASTDPNYGIAVEGNIYNAHYLTGNRYSWTAATAESGQNIGGNADASGSICAQGWRLPSGGRTATGEPVSTNEFANLLNRYGYEWTAKLEEWDEYYSPAIVAAGDNDLRRAPMYFLYGGNVDSGNLYGAGTNGNYWSATSSESGTNAYYLNFDSSTIYPSYSLPKHYGFSVRCVAR